MNEAEYKIHRSFYNLDLKELIKYSDVFVETGTCVGDGVQRALDAGFKNVLSVEVDKKFHDQAVGRFMGPACKIIFDNALVSIGMHDPSNGVHLFFGDSVSMLSEMLPSSKRAVVFLDAHPTGPGTPGHDDLMEKGDKSLHHQDNIIEREIEKVFESRNDHIILIDDMNGLNEGSKRHIKNIHDRNNKYEFWFLNQLVDTILYRDKVLVCIPVD